LSIYIGQKHTVCQSASLIFIGQKLKSIFLCSLKSIYLKCNYTGQLFIFEYINVSRTMLGSSSIFCDQGKMLDVLSMSVLVILDCSTCRFRRQSSLLIYTTRGDQVKTAFYSSYLSKYWSPIQILISLTFA
jgi:hypothetical protein